MHVWVHIDERGSRFTENNALSGPPGVQAVDDEVAGLARVRRSLNPR